MAKQLISFRGSLADDISNLMLLPGVDWQQSVFDYINANSNNLLSYRENNMLVIGKRCEHGKTPPDW